VNLYSGRQAHAGVILLRLDGLNRSQRADVVFKAVDTLKENLEGNFTVIKPNMVRVKQLK